MNLNHLLAKHGVMASFSIARKISRDKLKKLTDRLKKKSKNQLDLNELINKEIINTTQTSIENNLIPGIISTLNGSTSNNEQIPQKKIAMDEKKLIKFNYLAGTISKRFIDLKLSKDEICYILLYILSVIGLTDEDFRNFHRKYNPEYIEEDDMDDEDPEDQ